MYVQVSDNLTIDIRDVVRIYYETSRKALCIMFRNEASPFAWIYTDLSECMRDYKKLENCMLSLNGNTKLKDYFLDSGEKQ